MGYQKGLPPTQDVRADMRGSFGFGRASHGSDPGASYSLSMPLLPVIPSTLSPLNCAPERCSSATVNVEDLQFEILADDEEAARVKIVARSLDDAITLTLSVPLDSQDGGVDSTLVAAQACVTLFLQAVLDQLRARPLRLD